MLATLRKISNRLFRLAINKKLQRRLTNHRMSVIASNCNGALILHDLKEAFRSPFVNLYLEPADFIRYLQNPRHYQQTEPVFEQTDKPYPVAKLDDIRLYFVHYHSEREAREKWLSRSARIDWDNLFVMMTDRDGCTQQNIADFDALPYPNKVIFTHKAYPQFASAYYIRGFENQSEVGDLFEFSGWFGKKYYDQFDYVAWFNRNHG
ncbi:DUF1919 domain-containing protein [Bisgaard Taxon 10/6]|uniref:DUF1919 domain-containing protein n=1 Tax=Exercitatus varius TaxID=67857 RepID=UPI00294B131B|nr:DUF1919 domain-containing protein [Exercitatus varius]MDG2915116.1 DUF1919 domain-containing protein [Exercitatus varius]MDG2948603.1 DUF1919 domain-containing protein [Exercitatus varius]MDG2957601.1 DUF1919 domain-containing protein [Exercitatus varius]MDG2963351.1 DUF1919 domain-containing protein [Exercitatus varius]